MITPEIFCLAMFASVCALLLSGFPVAFILAGTSVAFAFLGYVFGVFDLTFLYAVPSRLFALMNREPLVAVPLFVFMGVMLDRARIAHELLDAMSRLWGRAPGGLAISVSLVGMLLAASTGIVGATVITLGLLSLPVMLGRGYDAAFATGTVAAAGTLGQIIPPSIILIFLGDQLSIAYQSAQFAAGNDVPDSVSINDLFAGALLPGLLLVALYIAYQIAYALMRPGNAPPLPPMAGEVDTGWQALTRLVRTLFAPLVLIFAVLGSILSGAATPSEAASVGAIGAMLLAGYRLGSGRRWPIITGACSIAGLLFLASRFDLRMNGPDAAAGDWLPIGAALILCGGLVWGVGQAVVTIHAVRTETGVSVLGEVLRTTVTITAMVFTIVIGASLFALVLRGFGGAHLIEGVLSDLPGGPLAAMLLVISVMFVLGFFLDFLEIIYVVVPIVAPVLLQMELTPGVPISPVWLGVMMAVVLQTSFLTPPFGFALFYLRGVAPDEVSTLQIYRGVAPFVLIQLASLAVIWFVPAIATWLPALLYGR